jgi:hypothetical protein
VSSGGGGSGKRSEEMPDLRSWNCVRLRSWNHLRKEKKLMCAAHHYPWLQDILVSVHHYAPKCLQVHNDTATDSF